MPPVLHRLKTFGESVDFYLWLSDPIIARFVGPFDAGLLAGALLFRAGCAGASCAFSVSCFVPTCSADLLMSGAGAFDVSSVSASGALLLHTSRNEIVLMFGKNFCRSEVTDFLAT